MIVVFMSLVLLGRASVAKRRGDVEGHSAEEVGDVDEIRRVSKTYDPSRLRYIHGRIG